MRFGWIAPLGIAGILIMSACSSASNEQASNNGKTTVNGNANTVVANSGDVIPVYPADANAANFASGEQVLPPPNSIKTTTLKKNGVPISTAEALETARKMAQPAPENSTFFSFLADAGYEVRTFNDHPQLLKVEKKTMNDGKTTVKVFLRGGKVVEMDGNRIPQLSSIPTIVILDLAGVQQKNPSSQQGPPQEKKPGE